MNHVMSYHISEFPCKPVFSASPARLQKPYRPPTFIGKTSYSQVGNVRETQPEAWYEQTWTQAILPHQFMLRCFLVSRSLAHNQEKPMQSVCWSSANSRWVANHPLPHTAEAMVHVVPSSACDLQGLAPRPNEIPWWASAKRRGTDSIVEAWIISGGCSKPTISLLKRQSYGLRMAFIIPKGWCPADDVLIHHFLLQLDRSARLDHVDTLMCPLVSL